MRKRDVLWLVLFLLIAVGIEFYFDQPKDRVVRYDCRMAEISVDFPVEVKEACRQIRLAKEK